jgi:succinoglycan biosynthesis transport protein ExoP
MNHDNDILDFSRLYLIIRKYNLVILAITGSFLTAALLYIYFATPLFTAETEIFLDQNLASVASDASSQSKSNFNSSIIDSQLEILKSKSLAMLVLDELKPKDFIDAVNAGDVTRQDEIIADTIDSLKVLRKGETHVLSIKFTADNAESASNFANAYAKSYVFDQISSLEGMSTTAAGWLHVRIEQLREQSKKAYAKVQAFRKSHNLYDSNGKPINEDQLKEMNDQLGLARANTATTKVKYEYSKSVVDSHDVNAAVAEAFENDVINNIRTEYLSSKKRLSELRRLLGSNHTTVLNLTQEIKEYENIILNEMERIAQSQLGEYKVALAREEAMEAGLRKLIEIKVDSESYLSELRDLELEAETFSTTYSNYLEKFQQLSQTKSFPASETRIISEATPPPSQSHPKVVLIIGVALVMGFGISLIIALYLNFTDRSIRDGEVIKTIGIPFIGFFPLINSSKTVQPQTTHKLNQFEFNDTTKTYVIDHPLSVQAETIRKARAFIDSKVNKSGTGKIIGLISCYPHEGKSTISANLALMLAQKGRCLLIDADVRKPTIRNTEIDGDLIGLGEVLKMGPDHKTPLIRELRTGLSILSAENASIESTLLELQPKILGDLIAQYSNSYDYVIVDLPPLYATSDAFSLSPFIDKYLLIIEWAATKKEELSLALDMNEIDSQKIVGAILNKADTSHLIKYHGYHIYADTAYFADSKA